MLTKQIASLVVREFALQLGHHMTTSHVFRIALKRRVLALCSFKRQNVSSEESIVRVEFASITTGDIRTQGAILDQLI